MDLQGVWEIAITVAVVVLVALEMGKRLHIRIDKTGLEVRRRPK